MANRHTLHKSKLTAFGDWLISDGWKIEDTNGFYEVLRAKKGKRVLIVYERIDMKEHYSLADRDCPIVRKFLNRERNRGNEQ